MSRGGKKRWAVAFATAPRFPLCGNTTSTYSPVTRRSYVGVTNDLFRRLAEHRAGMDDYTSKYHITRLVHFEVTANVMSAIAREKELKGWLRSRKIELIECSNPHWLDLATGWFDDVRVDPSSLRSSG